MIEFTDPDCPFCRKAEDIFKNRTDVTRYVFLFPLYQIHPTSMAKSTKILCSKEKERPAVYSDIVHGSMDDLKPEAAKDLKAFCSDQKVVDLLTEHTKLGQGMGIKGTPAFWVDGVRVNGADAKKIESLLSTAESTNTK